MFLYKLKANEANLLAVKNRTLYRLWNGGSDLKENWLAGRFGTVIRGAVVDDLGWDELEVEQVSCFHHCCSISSYPNFEFPAVFRLAFGEMTYSSSPRPTRARVTRSASSCSPAFGTAATSICREGSRQHNIAPDCGPKLNLIIHYVTIILT